MKKRLRATRLRCGGSGGRWASSALLEKEKAVQALQTKLALTEATNEEHTKRLDALRACYEKRLSEKEEEHQKAFRAFKRSVERAYAISKARLASAPRSCSGT